MQLRRTGQGAVRRPYGAMPFPPRAALRTVDTNNNKRAGKNRPEKRTN
jgi:hypothetical protein